MSNNKVIGLLCGFGEKGVGGGQALWERVSG